MQVKMDTVAYKRKLAQRTNDALVVVGNAVVGWASNQLRANGSVVTSNLVNSLTYSTTHVQGAIGGKTKGRPLSKPETGIVKVGSTVVYAARVEMGFVGKDSLGRYYNQPPKSYLRAAVMKNKERILHIFRQING